MDIRRSQRASALATAITFALSCLTTTVGVGGAGNLWSAKTVANERLDSMRGGFQTTNGLQLSFGIERAVFINGELVAVTRLVMSDLSNLFKGGAPSAELLGFASMLVQNGPGNTVATDSGSNSAAVAASTAGAGASAEANVASTGNAAISVAPPTNVAAAQTAGTSAAVQSQPAPAPVAPSTPVGVAPSTPVGVAPSTPVVVAPTPNVAATAGANPASPGTSTVSAAPPANVPIPTGSSVAAVQNKPASAAPSTPVVAAPTPSVAASAGASPVTPQLIFNGQTLLLPNAAGIMTAVQNSLNNQLIQTRTSIDATLNSLSLLRSGAFAAALRQQTLDSVRR